MFSDGKIRLLPNLKDFMRHFLNSVFLSLAVAFLLSSVPDVRAQEASAPAPEAPAQNPGGPELPEALSDPVAPEASAAEMTALPEFSPGEREQDAEPPAAAGDGGIVNLQSGMSLEDMVKTISEITSEVYLLGEEIKDKKVVIITPQEGFTRENAFRLFEILLDMNGYSVIGINGVNKIVRKKGIKTETLPLRLDEDPGESSHKYVMRLIKLRSVEAKRLSKVLRPMVSKHGTLKAYEPSNTLVIIDSEDNVNKVAEVVQSFDYDKKIEFVKVKNTDAASVMLKLVEIFNPSGGKTTRKKSLKADSDGYISGSSKLLGFTAIADERTNSIIVVARAGDMPLIKETIGVLDVESEHAGRDVYVIGVKNADAEQIMEVLGNLFSDGRAGRSGGAASSARRDRTAGGSSGALGKGGEIGGLGSGGRNIDRDSSGAAGSSVISVADGFRITSDPATNSVIVVGSVAQYRMVRRVVEKLDVRRRQVFVEAAILEVGLDNLRSLGGNFSLGLRIEGDNLGFVGQQVPGVPSLLGAAANSQSVATAAGSLSGLFLGVVGEEVDVDGSGPLPALPSFSAVFQALNSVTDVNVLSTPSIITTDNETAEIVVADVIPFPTGSTVGTSGVTVQTIERLPVGIRLNITPQISDGDYLNLNIVTEVSSTREAPSGLNTAQFGIATTTRSADSSVIVKNGQTLVIGGLVQDREEVLQNKTPLLGDIPVLGNLFKFQRNQRRKLNLMILLTPRIVETENDMKQLLRDYQKKKTLLHKRDLSTLE